MSEKSFVLDALQNGGTIKPLLIPKELTKGTGLFNPSVFVDNGKILVNIRHCQYTIYHSEKKKFEHEYGPLVYLNPENDITLTTTNYLCTLNGDLDITATNRIDTSMLDVRPIWDFVGLEDARLVRWNHKLYVSGVRRDTTPNGVGRMELSEIEFTKTGDVKELTRWRIPAPGPDNSYCEKNWMPIVDQPYHYIKWSNPTEVVRVDPDKGTCETVFVGEHENMPYDLRGGSQVIPYGDYYLAITHSVYLFNSEQERKDAVYRHEFVVWDKNFKRVKTTEPFNFMGADIEFCAGMAQHGDQMLITFGFQDNAAYIVGVPLTFIEKYINE